MGVAASCCGGVLLKKGLDATDATKVLWEAYRRLQQESYSIYEILWNSSTVDTLQSEHLCSVTDLSGWYKHGATHVSHVPVGWRGRCSSGTCCTPRQRTCWWAAAWTWAPLWSRSWCILGSSGSSLRKSDRRQKRERRRKKRGDMESGSVHDTGQALYHGGISLMWWRRDNTDLFYH